MGYAPSIALLIRHSCLKGATSGNRHLLRCLLLALQLSSANYSFDEHN
jgi:hypothetical protein